MYIYICARIYIYMNLETDYRLDLSPGNNTDNCWAASVVPCLQTFKLEGQSCKGSGLQVALVAGPGFKV